MVWHQPLELEYWFVNTFSGNSLIFTFISVIAIASMSVYFRMPIQILFVMLLIFALIMSQWIGILLAFPLILIGGVLTFWILSKVWKT